MSYKAKQIYVNLPVKNLNKSVEFFKKVGFEFNEMFTNEESAALIIGDNIFAMLSTEEKYKTFTPKAIADTAATTEVILAITADSKEQVDEIVNRALEAGGSKFTDSVDYGFMYYGSFQDVDGHAWEVLYMNESALPAE